jgi:hypothetical protein
MLFKRGGFGDFAGGLGKNEVLERGFFVVDLW